MKRHKEGDMHIGSRTYTKDTIHTHTQIYTTHIHTNMSTGPPISFLLRPPRPALVCVCR